MNAGDWYFGGHFKNDPCMPGTLMFEGGLQAMAFYLAALGFTLDHDGWRFEPVTGQECLLRCRGQVSPSSHRVVYEVFVSELSAAPYPTLYADVLGTVDGVKAFHARRAGLRLVPDWPLEYWRQLGPPMVQPSGQPVPLPALGGLRGPDRPAGLEACEVLTTPRSRAGSGRTTPRCCPTCGAGSARRSGRCSPASTRAAGRPGCPGRLTTS